MKLKTVKIKNDKSDSGYCFINESDLSDKHELFEVEKPKKKPKKSKKAE